MSKAIHRSAVPYTKPILDQTNVGLIGRNLLRSITLLSCRGVILKKEVGGRHKNGWMPDVCKVTNVYKT